MSEVYGHSANQPVVWFHRHAGLSNQYCLYCGRYVGEHSILLSDKEHLIGRRFVPPGYLCSTDFNFLFRACRRCNADKAEAERHVSAVTLFNSPERYKNPEIERVVQRKGLSDYHPAKPGTRLKDSGDEHSVSFRTPALNVTFGLSSPPQPHPAYVRALALFQVQALFSLVTTENPKGAETTRLLPQRNIYVFGYYGYEDWGNEQLVTAVDRAIGWTCPLNVHSARGYFRAVLRRGTSDPDDWFWGLEWNRSLRVVGGITAADATPQIFTDLPALEWLAFPSGSERIRIETQLNPEADQLFLNKRARSASAGGSDVV